MSRFMNHSVVQEVADAITDASYALFLVFALAVAYAAPAASEESAGWVDPDQDDTFVGCPVRVAYGLVGQDRLLRVVYRCHATFDGIIPDEIVEDVPGLRGCYPLITEHQGGVSAELVCGASTTMPRHVERHVIEGEGECLFTVFAASDFHRLWTAADEQRVSGHYNNAWEVAALACADRAYARERRAMRQ